MDPASIGLTRIASLAIGTDNNLYVTESKPGVAVISPVGKLVRRWGGAGSKPGEFSFEFASDSPLGAGHTLYASIAIGGDGLIYVSDTANDRVQVFTATGQFVRQIAFTRPEGVLAPGDVAADAGGNVYIFDNADQSVTISKYSKIGALLWRVGGTNESDPDLQGHAHFSEIDSQGRLVFAIDDTGKVVYLGPDGRKVAAFDTKFDAKACDVTLDLHGDQFVNGCDPGTVVFDSEHQLVGGWIGPDDPFATAPRFGPNGAVWALGRDGSILGLTLTLP